jgi:predicted TIM-barrel fold metal-dependent hydrolase
LHREEATLVMVSAYNDWHIDEWAGSYPDRFIPIAILPTWNPEAMCREIRRVAAKGCRAVTMPELPHLEGLPSDVFREHSLACYVTDKTSLKLRHEIGIDIIAWECDYPHSDCFWPDAPEQVLAELNAAGASDSDINKITWENSCRFFGWDPFKLTAKDQATAGALRAKATDVDVSIRPRAEWAQLYARKQMTLT